MKNQLFILDHTQPTAVDSLLVWATWYETADRQVAKTILPDGFVVSTIFLGLDYSVGHGGMPLLFETMIFSPDMEDQDCWRYATWDEAAQGHAAAVNQYRQSYPLFFNHKQDEPGDKR